MPPHTAVRSRPTVTACHRVIEQQRTPGAEKKCLADSLPKSSFPFFSLWTALSTAAGAFSAPVGRPATSVISQRLRDTTQSHLHTACSPESRMSATVFASYTPRAAASCSMTPAASSICLAAHADSKCTHIRPSASLLRTWVLVCPRPASLLSEPAADAVWSAKTSLLLLSSKSAVGELRSMSTLCSTSRCRRHLQGCLGREHSHIHIHSSSSCIVSTEQRTQTSLKTRMDAIP